MDYVLIFIYFYIISILFNTTHQELFAEFNHACNLTLEFPNDPKPSLSQCYNFNDLSCCNSVHDYFIKQKLINLLTSNCLTKYPELNNLFCLFCSPYQPFFASNSTVNSNNRQTIKLCKGFLDQLWTPSSNYSEGVIFDLNSPTNKFDNCGFQRVSDNLANGYITRQDFIRPSTEYLNVTDFLYKIKIPFAEDFDFEIIDETKYPSDSDVQMFCFMESDYIKSFITIRLIVALVLF